MIDVFFFLLIQPEAIPESLKNMLLVMETQGVLEVGSAPPVQEEVSKISQ